MSPRVKAVVDVLYTVLVYAIAIAIAAIIAFAYGCRATGVDVSQNRHATATTTATIEDSPGARVYNTSVQVLGDVPWPAIGGMLALGWWRCHRDRRGESQTVDVLVGAIDTPCAKTTMKARPVDDVERRVRRRVDRIKPRKRPSLDDALKAKGLIRVM